MNGEGLAIVTRAVGGVCRLRHGAMVHHSHDQPSIVELYSGMCETRRPYRAGLFLLPDAR